MNLEMKGRWKEISLLSSGLYFSLKMKPLLLQLENNQQRIRELKTTKGKEWLEGWSGNPLLVYLESIRHLWSMSGVRRTVEGRKLFH